MALEACALACDPGRALTYLRGMRDRSDFRPTSIHYTMAVEAMVAAGRTREAHQLLAEAVQVKTRDQWHVSLASLFSS